METPEDKAIFDAEKLKRLRKREGLTQPNLEYELDLSVGHISKLESGRYKTPSISVVYKIATHFDRKVDAFIVKPN